MKKAALLLVFCLFLFCNESISLFAQTADTQFDRKSDSDNSDMEALRRWLQDKRLVTMREIGGDLSISGEVRTEFQAVSEERNGQQQRSRVAGRPMYAWDIEVNLMLDYRTDRSWAAIKLEFDNRMGSRSGTVIRIKLEKAYLGGRFVAGDTFIMDGEIGRRNLINSFDSKVQFSSLFDGILFRFSKAFPSLGDSYVNAAAFLIDDKTNHYGFVGEIGALRIANVGLNLKYSLIDWYRPGSQSESGHTSLENHLADLRYRFLISQFLTSFSSRVEARVNVTTKISSIGILCNRCRTTMCSIANVFPVPADASKRWGPKRGHLESRQSNRFIILSVLKKTPVANAIL